MPPLNQTPRPSATPSSGTGGESGRSVEAASSDLLTMALLAAFFVFVFAAVYLWPRTGKNGAPGRPAMAPTFARVYGLLVVAAFAVTLAFASVGEEGRTAAFTVLGAIAGYLAGAKSTTTTTKPAGPDTPTDQTGVTVTESGL